MIHNLHRIIGKILTTAFSELEVFKDPACGGNKLVSLFCSKKKSGMTKYADVDIAIIKDGKVRVIVEIEESERNPVHVFGKFLASALSSYLIKEYPVELDSVLFIQIMDTSNLKAKRTSKLKQFKSIEKSIQSIIPLKNSKIIEYRMFFCELDDFENGEVRKEFIDCIQNHLFV